MSMWGPIDMTRLDPPPTAAALTAREQLELYVAMAQFRFGMVALGVYFLVLIAFLCVIQFIAKDNQLTLAVLLFQPITLLVGGVGAFWFQRARNAAQDSAPSVTTTTTTPAGGTVTTVAPAAPAPALPAGPVGSGGGAGAATPPGGGNGGTGTASPDSP
jgi:hypothetical protein